MSKTLYQNVIAIITTYLLITSAQRLVAMQKIEHNALPLRAEWSEGFDLVGGLIIILIERRIWPTWQFDWFSLQRFAVLTGNKWINQSIWSNMIFCWIHSVACPVEWIAGWGCYPAKFLLCRMEVEGVDVFRKYSSWGSNHADKRFLQGWITFKSIGRQLSERNQWKVSFK